MGILTWVIIGLVSGLGVNLLKELPDRKALGDILLGALGAITGGLIASRIFGIADPIDGFNLVAILFSCAGAVILVASVEAMNSRRVAA